MYDVIIAGAGPSGSSCARACANAGLSVLLLDQHAFPRRKPCAGAVSAQALALLDFAVPPEVIEKECFGVLIQHGGRTIDARKAERIAVLVSREPFDRLLVDKAVEAGVELHENEAVADVEEQEERVTVATTKGSYSGRFLIGADGMHSRVARSVRPDFRKDEIVLAAVSNASAADEEIDRRLGNTLAIRFGIAPLGYGWLFPHRGYFSLGAAGLASTFTNLRATLDSYGRRVQIAPEEVRGHFIPLGGMKRRIATTRVLLAGDAAGFADPFHGEGILYAILSGQLAARSVADGIGQGRERNAASRYVRECERSIRKQLSVALLMARTLDRFPGLFLRLFFDNRRALEQYLDIPSGRSDYRRFLRWLVISLPVLLVSSVVRNFRGQQQERCALQNRKDVSQI